MPLYGYARVSSLDQDLTLQEETLRAAGCHVVRAEKRSGAGREGRTELRLLLDFLHPATRSWSPASTGSPARSRTCRTSSTSSGPRASR